MQPIEASIVIAAPPAAVWAALTDPDAMRRWMGEPEMRIDVRTDWRPGSAIVIAGEHHGPFENRGVVLDVVPGRRLRYSHRSSVSQLPDEPGSDSVIGFELMPVEGGTALKVTVDGFPTEGIHRHLALYWRGTLGVFKGFVEGI